MGYKKPGEYTLIALHASANPVDSETRYWGMFALAPTTTQSIRKIYIPRSGNIRAAIFYNYAATAGTAEDISLYIRKNATTDYLIQTTSVSSSHRTFINYALNISVTAGDYIELKYVYPAWVTNPLDMQTQGTILVETE